MIIKKLKKRIQKIKDKIFKNRNQNNKINKLKFIKKKKYFKKTKLDKEVNILKKKNINKISKKRNIKR